MSYFRLHWPKIRRWGIRLAIAGCIWFFLAVGIIHVYGYRDEQRPVDVIVVLGSGLRRDGHAGPSLTRRSLRAAELWHQGLAPQIICTGGKTERAPRPEAEACRDILLEQGVPSGAITLENRSFSTEENAINTRAIMEAQGWQTALLVSDAYHMLRAQIIFRSQGIEAYISPVPVSEIPFSFYLWAITREVAAIHWLAIKTVLNLPITHVGGL